MPQLGAILAASENSLDIQFLIRSKLRIQENWGEPFQEGGNREREWGEGWDVSASLGAHCQKFNARRGQFTVLGSLKRVDAFYAPPRWYSANFFFFFYFIFFSAEGDGRMCRGPRGLYFTHGYLSWWPVITGKRGCVQCSGLELDFAREAEATKDDPVQWLPIGDPIFGRSPICVLRQGTRLPQN